MKTEGRQTRTIPKTRFDFMAENGNYDYIAALARQYCVSMAAVLNAILRCKPEPEFHAELIENTAKTRRRGV